MPPLVPGYHISQILESQTTFSFFQTPQLLSKKRVVWMTKIVFLLHGTERFYFFFFWRNEAEFRAWEGKTIDHSGTNLEASSSTKNYPWKIECFLEDLFLGGQSKEKERKVRREMKIKIFFYFPFLLFFLPFLLYSSHRDLFRCLLSSFSFCK